MGLWQSLHQGTNLRSCGVHYRRFSVLKSEGKEHVATTTSRTARSLAFAGIGRCSDAGTWRVAYPVLPFCLQHLSSGCRTLRWVSQGAQMGTGGITTASICFLDRVSQHASMGKS